MEKNKRKILAIDDQPHILRVIELKFKKHFEVITAKNGQQGLELIKSEKPDVVVTDINMPKMDGKTLCMETNPFKKDRPFLTVVMTARISPEEREWINEMTDTVFIEKPFSPSMLLETINKYLKND